MFYSGILRGLVVGIAALMLTACAAESSPDYMNLHNSFKDPGSANDMPSSTGVPGSLVGLIGGNNLTASGSGALSLNGNTYSGGTTVISGVITGAGATLAAGNTEALGSGQVALAEVAPTTEPAEIVKRTMIYEAGLYLVVPNVRQAMIEIQKQASDMGGYLQEMNNDVIVVRVPAGKFNEAMAAIEHMGEVTQRQIKAQDVTEEMRDLTIRLENAEAVRVRLAALLDKSLKMADTLEIEKELERVTEEIELMKGKIQYLQAHVAFSSIQVTVNSPLPQKEMVAQIPFDWVRELGDGLVSGNVELSPDTSHWLPRNARFVLPANYIRYYERDYVTEAMSSDGMLIKLKRQDNYDGGDVGFWSDLCRRTLVENRTIALEPTQDLKLKSGDGVKLFVGSKEIGGKPFGYMLGVVTTKRHVYTFEAWGPKEQFARDGAVLQQAMMTLDVKW